jgi:hypothetical protein
MRGDCSQKFGVLLALSTARVIRAATTRIELVLNNLDK